MMMVLELEVAFIRSLITTINSPTTMEGDFKNTYQRLCRSKQLKKDVVKSDCASLQTMISEELVQEMEIINDRRANDCRRVSLILFQNS